MLKYLPIVSLSLLLTSCAVIPQQEVVEVLQPGENRLSINPDDRIVLVANYRLKSKFVQGNSSAFVDDSLQVMNTAKLFADSYRGVGYFTDAYVPIKPLRIVGQEQNELSADKIRAITILDKPRYVVELSLLRTLIEPVDRFTFKTTFASLWRIYDASSFELTQELVFRDSLYYDQYETVGRALFDSTIANDVEQKVSQRLSSALLPHWQQVLRYYMTSSTPEFNQVAKLIRDFKWKQVVEYMTPFLASDDKNEAYAAAYNIALACEMTGQYDLALKWLDKCDSLKKTSATRLYRTIITDRISDEKALSL